MRDKSFKDRLMATVLCLPDVLGDDGFIVGSEVPNLYLLQRGLPGRGLFVSQDVDVALSMESTSQRIRALEDWKSSDDEPSILLPVDATKHMEINLLGIDPEFSLDEVAVHRRGGYVIFGTLGLIQKTTLALDGVKIPVASLSTIALEKLATARSGIKGDRDLHVALMAIELMDAEEHVSLKEMIHRLPDEYRHHATGGVANLYTEQSRADTQKGKRLGGTLRDLLGSSNLDLEAGP
jgi:hypothetical protein